MSVSNPGKCNAKNKVLALWAELHHRIPVFVSTSQCSGVVQGSFVCEALSFQCLQRYFNSAFGHLSLEWLLAAEEMKFSLCCSIPR